MRRRLFAIALAAIFLTTSAAANAANEYAANKSICDVSFASGAQAVSVLQVVVAAGLAPCADSILTRIQATLTCSAPALAPMNVWPMFSWKSHEYDSPKYISAFDESSGRSGASMAALGVGSDRQPLSIPVLLPPSCCGLGLLQARPSSRFAAALCCWHLVLTRRQLELSDDNGDIIASSAPLPFSVSNSQPPRRVCSPGEAMRITAPAAGSAVSHAFLADLKRLPVLFTCDAVPGAVHRLMLNADVYLQWNEHHLQSLDADFGDRKSVV